MEEHLTGTIRGLLLFDIAESIDLTELHHVLGTISSRREPAFLHPSPEYVKFERPPVIEQVGVKRIQATGEEVEIRIRYFDYGVASVELLMTFSATWPDLIRRANSWISSTELESYAADLLKDSLGRTGKSLNKPYSQWISEDYFVVQLNPVQSGNEVLSAADLVRDCGVEIAQIVRGEETPLSPTEQREVLKSTMSYYPNDLLVLGWVAAFIYESRVAASPTIDLLEYANTQLLEFRYYDDVLTDVLADVYKRLERRHTMLARWRLAREAETLNTIRLDYQELVERTDNAIKFLSDMYYARVYRLAAARIGVSDYRRLVNDKLTTARDLYESMVNEFHQGRTFFLEVMVVLILMVEIVFLFVHKG